MNDYNYLFKWIFNAYNIIMKNDYDYVFGGIQYIKGKKIGFSILLSKASIIENLLYYTDSDTTHANPFIQMSVGNRTKFNFLPFKDTKLSNL